MGVHYVNDTLVGDAEVRLLRPEALIYEPQADGAVTGAGPSSPSGMMAPCPPG